MRKINLQIPRITSLDEARNVIAQAVSDSLERFFTWLRAPYFGGQRLREVGTPTAPDDAATKGYVDEAIHAGEASTVSTSTSSVGGASKLRTPGAIPKVSSPGSLDESALSDDGVELKAFSRLLHLTDNADDGGWFMSLSGVGTYLIHGATWDGAAWTAKETTATIIQAQGGVGGVLIYSDTGLTVGNTFTPTLRATLDASGNVDASGIYKVGGAPGVTGALTLGLVHSTIQYKDWTGVNQSASVVTSVSLTSNAFTGGIRTT